MLTYKPPRIAMGLLLAAIIVQRLSPPSWPSLPSSIMGGVIIVTLGFAIMLRAWWLFRQRGAAVCPTARTSVLITSDIYRLTRNPMYLGIVLILTGIAIGTGGPGYYVASLSFFLIIDFVFCPFEEQKLTRTFAGAFTRYKSDVRRWL
jgi:protein-S-isoprenylcysteine O-methyltransferase Ste14